MADSTVTGCDKKQCRCNSQVEKKSTESDGLDCILQCHLSSQQARGFTDVLGESQISKVCMCMVITYSRVWINRVRLPILLVVSWTGKIIFPCPRACLRIWSRETGSAVPSRVSLLIFILRLGLKSCFFLAAAQKDVKTVIVKSASSLDLKQFSI